MNRFTREYLVLSVRARLMLLAVEEVVYNCRELNLFRLVVVQYRLTMYAFVIP